MMAWGCPVLMYHKVGAEVADPTDRFLNITAASFLQQMRALTRLGYRARPFRDIVEAVTRGQTLPRKTFAITFDDGYRCISDVAAPLLAEFGYAATVFVVSDCVGKINAWDAGTGHARCELMDWPHLLALQSAGWEIGGHTRSHPHLATLSDAEAQAEILESKQATEAKLGTRVRTFCYPYGDFNPATPLLVAEAGFEGACTTRSGLAHTGREPFLLPRVKVYHEGVVDLLYRVLLRPALPTLRAQKRSHSGV